MHEMPPIVCLCGSTRFKDEFMDATRRLTLEGKIVLSVGMFAHADGAWDQIGGEDGDVKKMLDELHKRKIDLAESILVLNVGGYVGESTTGEILYAEARGKTITFLEPYCFTLPDGDCIGTGCMHDYDTRGDC